MIKQDLFHRYEDGSMSTNQPINVIHHVNKMEDKNHMIISIDAEKVSDKIKHSFKIKKKIPQQVSHKRNVPQRTKDHI